MLKYQKIMLKQPNNIIQQGMHQFKHWCINKPYQSSFTICFAKGIMCDLLAQKVLEKREKINYTRNLAFGVFSGVYCGSFMNLLYNNVYTQMFGTCVRSGVFKTAFELLVHIPFVYFPSYYGFKSIIKNQNFLTEYINDPSPIVLQYWKVWGPSVFIIFNFVPLHLRITSVACMSFGWMIYLSYTSPLA